METWTLCEAFSESLWGLRFLSSLYSIQNRFEELKADPSKAKKPHHRPKNAKDFAVNYVAGYYSLVDDSLDARADEKSHK